MPDTRRDLLDLLAARSGLSQGEIAGRLGVSTRTARRHLTGLVAERLVHADADGPARRYRLAEGATPAVALPALTEDETEALSVAALAARPLLAPTPLLAALDSAAAKLSADAMLAHVVRFEPDIDAGFWSFDGAAGGRPPDVEADIFRSLLDGAREQHPVVADYFTASRNSLTRGRRLGPLGFLVRSGAWLVAAADLDTPGRPVKDFALAGFRAVAPCPDEHVAPPAGFSMALYARDRFGALDGEVELVRLLVEPAAVPYFERKEYNPTQQVEERHADGRAVVSFEAGGMGAVASFVLSWGPKVRVLEPAALAAQVAEAHRAAWTLYQNE